ncbi:hypothetical protein FB451DRAFT_1182850 [Mycena latifolia]|nr:hypothetical protein FB451DRAFT_1182850 [Mycena latifolia]
MDGLPTLTAFPSRHLSSCAALSLPLLEALLLQRHPHRARPDAFRGVEVAQARATNRFLPEAHTAVPGTWAVAPDAERAEGLLFVYPRQPALVRAYLARGARRVMREWGEEDHEAAGGGAVLEDGEAVMVLQRRAS